MKIQKATRDSTRSIGLGVCALTAVMLGVYCILHLFSVSVLLGALIGAFFSILNFFLMCLSIQAASDKMNGVHLPPLEQEQEQETENGDAFRDVPLSPEARSARTLYRASYLGRLMMIALAAIAAAVIPQVDLVAAMLPFLFPRILIFLYSLMQKKGLRSHE